MDMTQGNPARQIILFSLPMLAGNLFQQLYNIVDTMVVGRYVSYQALAAVGSSFAIITFINSVIIGLCMGAAVLFSQLYGAGDSRQLSPSISTAFIFIIGFSLALSLITLLLTRPIVLLYQMPAETVDMACTYLRYIFAGLFFTGLYHFCANLLRSFGDSRTPLLFLILSCFINIGLDLLLVLAFGMGVSGVALATLAAQAVSAVLCLGYTLRRLKAMGISVRLEFRRPLFGRIMRFSVLTSLQQSVMNFGILLVQGLVNTFGALTTAAFSAGVKIDAFAYMPVQDYGNAFCTFVAQNTGANKPERIRRGLRFSGLAIAGFCSVASLLIYIFAPQLIGLFVSDGQDVVRLGAQYLRVEGLFYALIGYLFMFYGYFRGIGKPMLSVALTVASLGSRVLLAYTLAPALGFSAVALAIVAGWLLADGLGLYFLRRYGYRAE